MRLKLAVLRDRDSQKFWKNLPLDDDLTRRDFYDLRNVLRNLVLTTISFAASGKCDLVGAPLVEPENQIVISATYTTLPFVFGDDSAMEV